MIESIFPPIAILHEESHFMVIDKPVGLFSQAAPGVDSVQVRLTQQIKDRDQHAGNPFVGLPHRLDRGTSGVMLIARNQRALSKFGEQFQSRKIGKFYLAAAVGSPLSEPMLWSDYVRKVPDQALAEVCLQETEGAKLAELTARTVSHAGGVNLMLIHLHTGRMHQIRVQAASRGLRILGDLTYGGPPIFDIADDDVSEGDAGANKVDNEEQASMLLHALRLELRHPQTAKSMAFTAFPPPSWKNLPKDLCDAINALCKRSQSEHDTSWSMKA
jgi:23S rRNA pseudouridine1911/1915/1917 synthase